MVNDITREYSVYISDENNTVQGSGVLFYAGGDSLFVFTCAHVVDDLDLVRVDILKVIDSTQDLYKDYCTTVPASQIIFSPLDTVTIDEAGEKRHSEDLAVIQIGKPADINLNFTDYFLTDVTRGQSVYVQGYPNGVPEGENLIEYLDCLHCEVLANVGGESHFSIRMIDSFIDQGARVSELKGLSGAPVWDDNEKSNGFAGLLTNAYGSTALLGKVRAVKNDRIRSIMYERFGILINRKLESIPEEDVAGNDFFSVRFNGIVVEGETEDNKRWIEEQLSGLRMIIEDMKLQGAIDKGRELCADERYKTLSIASKRRLKRNLLYCYEIADMDEEFDDLEAEMRNEGLIQEHDMLRQLTRSFMKREFDKTIEAAQRCIDTWNGVSGDDQLSFAKAFLLLARAYTEKLPVEETIGILLDENENFIYPINEAEGDALIYQMIGYVYGERYHDYVNSVRFLNRAYRVGFDCMVLESLGAAYYNLGVYDATDENGTVKDMRMTDQKALYKARECYLIILEKADELFWAGTMRRMGLCVYNTFVFLNDNYRILTTYKDIKKYLPYLEDKEWRDIEMKYARVIAQKGEINVLELPHITRKNRLFLEMIAFSHRCMSHLDEVTAQYPTAQIRHFAELERELKTTLYRLEKDVRKIDREEQVPIYIHMINFYGRGIQLFDWDKKDKVHDLYERLSDFGDTELLETIGNFIFELDGLAEEAEKRFQATFERNKNIRTWQEITRFYIRHRMFDKADAMYKELLSKRKELIKEGPEYAYRAFIDYVTVYKRDIKYALQCYLEAEESFHDTDIEGFWELELMLYTNTFNEPERFETERDQFLKNGFITEEQYHRTAFIAYMANLDKEKTKEHFGYIRQYQHNINSQNGRLILNLEEIHFLNWMGWSYPKFPMNFSGMSSQRAEAIRNGYEKEKWHRPIDKVTENRISLYKSIVVDSWGLYQLMDTGKLEQLNGMDNVYVSHLTVIRLLDELSKSGEDRIRYLLDFLSSKNKIRLYSASFKAQLDVRKVTVYDEPASAVAVGVEKDCLIVLGEPLLEHELIDYFGSRIIRVDEIEIFLGNAL